MNDYIAGYNNSFKILAQLKHDMAISVLKCECMLCTKIDTYKTPTITCPWESMWLASFFPCCCTFHGNPNQCKMVKNNTQCLCARCCRKCFGGNTSVKCISNCSVREKYYVKCEHFKGYCN